MITTLAENQGVNFQKYNYERGKYYMDNFAEKVWFWKKINEAADQKRQDPNHKEMTERVDRQIYLSGNAIRIFKEIDISVCDKQNNDQIE